MKNTIRKSTLLFATFILTVVFLTLSEFKLDVFGLLNLVGFPMLVLLPGFLTLVAFDVKRLGFWPFIGFSVGLSLLELMLLGLGLNAVLPASGILPLTRISLIHGYTVGIGVLMGLIWNRRRDTFELPFAARPVFTRARDAAYALFPALFVITAELGAIHLNDGGSGIFTLLTLIAIAAYAGLLFTKRRTFGENVLPTALFFISLSLLFMTSLRGWYITGHDIQREFGVFQLTKNASLWNIAAYRDAYNACLSITILPTIFARLLAVPDAYIYKVLFQILFAITPAVLFAFLRRLADESVAYLSVLYFVAFPTFFGDMPFLIRQETAFLFFALMLLVLFMDEYPLRLRRRAFLLLGIGLVLSHYSTTYIVVALLLCVVVGRPLVRIMGRAFGRFRLFAHSGFEALSRDYAPSPRITVWMFVALAAMSFFWSSILTHTASGSLVRVVDQTVAVVRSNLASDSRSNDVGYSLLYAHSVDPSKLLAQYDAQFVAPLRSTATSSYYSSASVAAYPASYVPFPRMPLTVLGRGLSRLGVDVTAVQGAIRQGSAKLLQLFILAGIAAAFVSRRRLLRPLSNDFALLAAASLCFVAAQVVLPILSVEYGLLRAFQQALVFLGLFAVLGTLALPVGGEERRQWVAAGLVLAFFLSTTGVLTQLTGGYEAQLHLDNSGSYYDQYYVHRGERLSTSWFASGRAAGTLPPGDVQANPLLSEQLGLGADPRNGIYPGIVRVGSYVILGDPTVTRGVASLSYEGTQFEYAYPVGFLDSEKDVIYANNDSRIYR